MKTCDRRTRSPLQIQSSSRRRRRSTQAWSCAICLSLFSSAGELDTHAKGSKHKSFCCTRHDCQKLFGRRTALARHHSSHLDIKGHYCITCAKSFHRKDHCDDHEQLCGRRGRKRRAFDDASHKSSFITAGQNARDNTKSLHWYDASASNRREDIVDVPSILPLITSQEPVFHRTAQEECSGLSGSDCCAPTGDDSTENTSGDRSSAYKEIEVTFTSTEDRDLFLQALLDSGEDVNATDDDAKDGRTSLHVAAESGTTFAIEPLIQYGASLDKQDYFASTSLFLAARGGHREVVTTLLRHGANPNIANKLGDTALHAAVRYGHNDIVRYLLSYGANVDAVNHNKSTPLHWAASFNRWDVMTNLIDHGASVAARDCDGDTPLHLAADFGAVAAVTKLAGSGCNLDAKNMAGQTALHRAALGGYAETFVVLLSMSANEQAKDVHGHTPLDYNTVRTRLAEAINDRTLEVSWADDPELFGTEAIVETIHGSTSEVRYTNPGGSTVKHDPVLLQSPTLYRACWCGDRASNAGSSATRQPLLRSDGNMSRVPEVCPLPYSPAACYSPCWGLEPFLTAHVGCRGMAPPFPSLESLPDAPWPSFALISA